MKSFSVKIIPSFALLIFFVCVFLGQGANATEAAHTIEFTVSFSPSDLTFDKIYNYDIVRLSDRSYLNQVGKPMLPFKRLRYALPDGMAARNINIVSAEIEEIAGEFNIFPAQPPRKIGQSDSELTFVEPDRDVYGSAQPYPSNLIEFVRQSDLAGQGIAEIIFYPLQYIPALKKLNLLTSITFAIEGDDGYICGDYLPDNISEEGMKDYRQRLMEAIVNQEDIALKGAPSLLKSGTVLPPGDPFDHIIITSAFNAPLYQPLADWHTRKGLRDTMITVDYIYANYTGAGETEKIRNFIIDAHQNWGTLYFLLAGEHNTVPFEYRIYDDENIPSDAYYGDYDDDWEYEVYVGRMTAEGSVQIERAVNRIIKYETHPPLLNINYPLDITLVGMDLTIPQDPPYYTWTQGELLKDTIAIKHIPPRFIVNKIYDSNSGNHRDDFLEALNFGHNLINHCDHCNRSVMGVGSRNHDWHITSNDVLYLTNYHSYSVIYSLGCYANMMDFNDAISEYFVFGTDSAGAVAFTGNTRSGWFYVGEPLSLSGELDLYWWVGLFDYNKYRLGEALAFAKSAATTDVTHPYSEWTLNLLGEPEMPIWTDRPIGFVVTHPTELAALPSDFEVHVEKPGGIAVGQAFVCLWKGSEVYERGYTDTNGDVNFNISPTTTGPIYVTVTKQNHVPYRRQAEVVGNAPPICQVPNDTTIFQCTLTEVSLPVGCFDPDGNLASGPELVKGPGQIIGDGWYYTPLGEDSVSMTIRCTDSLGYSCETAFSVIFEENDVPVCIAPNDTSIVHIAPPSEINLPISAHDDNDNLAEIAVISGPGMIADGYWRYTPADDGEINVTIRSADSCGAYTDDSFQIDYKVYACGDANDDGTINLLDITGLIDYLYSEGPTPDPIMAGDANGDGTVNLLDITYLINHLYRDGPAPICP